MRVVFFGTPAFAVPTLDRLSHSSHPVAGVVTQPDRPRGRGQQITAGPVKALAESLAWGPDLETAIIFCHLRLLAGDPDSLIARKCGLAEAAEASARASRVLALGWPGSPAGQRAMADLDAWLRAEGNRRNPGTTADLVAACLFVALRGGIITLPRAFGASEAISD